MEESKTRKGEKLDVASETMRYMRRGRNTIPERIGAKPSVKREG